MKELTRAAALAEAVVLSGEMTIKPRAVLIQEGREALWRRDARKAIGRTLAYLAGSFGPSTFGRAEQRWVETEPAGRRR